MPISLTVDHEKRRAAGVASGVVSMADLAQYMAERVRLGAYSYPQILDLRDGTIELPPGESLYARAMQVRQELRAGEIPQTAIVASPGTASYGLVRQLSTQLGFAKVPVEVFTNLDDAETWLASGAKRQDPRD